MKKVITMSAIALLLSGCSTTQQDSQQKENSNQSVSQQDIVEKEEAPKTEWTIPTENQNKVKKEDGHFVLENPENMLALVNKEYYLPSDYEPKDLVRPDVAFSFGDEDIEKSHMRKEAAEALADMFNGAKDEGLILYASSGYRSYDRQAAVFKQEVANVGEENAEQAVAIPGSSEHQSGLAMDITSQKQNFLLTEEFGEDKEGKWLMANAYKYGFILRYPKDKVDITQYEYEPWHYRYVGKDAAKVMQDKDWTLEEYFENGTKQQ
ncbi:D-alanyl-D-alanine carboxypeptidase family protein [Niallia circulans]|uniref:D-alanyl-D-alanine carboxypeptidase family protein n=1 Tax=Niallia circulans TaxID=1397 RepID=A0A553SNM9_NIACI|nr:D-alanyl-D-alanine carboxypeptidase family protein [Niallia circulans]TRZ38577.1 D-alanyl-D-alanine carboxypeptidase family protein [Niallia circulans]